MSRDDALLLDIADTARRALRHVGALDAPAFAGDEMVQDAVVRCLTVIGEAASRLSEEARRSRCAVPWAHIVGMRNLLVHDYGAVDPDEVFKTVTVDLPVMLERLGPLPGSGDGEG